MKKAGFFLAAAFCIALVSAKTSAQVPITYYDFENNTTRTAHETTVEQQINSGNSVFARVGLNNVITGNTGAGITLYSGATTGSAIQSTTWPNNASDPGTGATNYYQFTVNTSGFTGTALSFDVFAGTTPASYPFVGVLISTNGVAGPFSQLIAGFNPGLSSWSTQATLLPSAADNNSNVVIRIYGYLSDNSVNGTMRLDNVTIYAASTTTTAGTKTLLNEDNIYTSMTSGLTGANFTRGSFTVTGSGTTVTLSSTVAIASGSTFTVSNSATLSFGSVFTFVFGAGAFTLNSGTTMQINSANGISSTANTGNIQLTGTRTFSSGANYVYIRNATGAQVTGNQLPTSLTGNLTANLGTNADSPLTLTQSTTVAGTVTVSTKNF
jgi:hypothetical protein